MLLTILIPGECMPLELKLAPKLTYKLRLSPQMKLSLNLLQLPLIKLKDYISEEIEKNPLLEPADAENIGMPMLQHSEPLQEQVEPQMPWSEEDEEKKEYRENLITAPLTLQEHLLKQLHLVSSSDQEVKIGELIIGNIDNDGYLRCPIEDIAESCKTTIQKAEKVLTLVQTFDPMGIGARDLRECLLLQLKAKQQENSLTGQIVDNYLSFLEKKRYNYIAKKLKVSIKEIKDAVKEIASLEPKPGRSFSTETTCRLIPDAILRKDRGNYEVILNDWELPHITINDKYKKMLKQKDTPDETKKYLKERFNAAKTLIDAINKRKETIQRVIEDIVYIQKDFLGYGAFNFKPMTLSDIANRIGKHKSTVSRAIANKYLQTPNGIIQIRYFLNSGVKQKNGEFYSSKNIKLKIQEIIKREDKNKPLTDQEIAHLLLKQSSTSVSRRTIAKYRTQLKILPAKSRQE